MDYMLWQGCMSVRILLVVSRKKKIWAVIILSSVCFLFLLFFYYWSHPALWRLCSLLQPSMDLQLFILADRLSLSLAPSPASSGCSIVLIFCFKMTFCSIFMLFTLELWEFHKCFVGLPEIQFLSSGACSGCFHCTGTHYEPNAFECLFRIGDSCKSWREASGCCCAEDACKEAQVACICISFVPQQVIKGLYNVRLMASL